jgi:hypothetical protein
MSRLSSPRSPALPIAQNLYTKTYQDTFGNILRLYFNQLDAVNSALHGPLGTRYLNTAHIAASDSVDQYADGNNTPTVVLWDSVESNAGFTLNLDSSATVPASGTYKIDFSIQLANSSNTIHDAFIWLTINDVAVANSSSRFSVAARKSATEFAYVVAYSSIVFAAEGGDTFKLLWATDLAATSDGLTTGIYMEHIDEQVTPYARPKTPSAIGSIVMISCPCDEEII